MLYAAYHLGDSIWLLKYQLQTPATMGSSTTQSNMPTSQWATLATLAILLATRCLADGETKVYINTVPGYSELVPCAVYPLSTIVRDMSQGCGENADAITSYTCFCTLSSSIMSSVISKDVSSQCRNSSALQQVSSAIAVFDAYCDLGVESGLTVDPLPSKLLPWIFVLCSSIRSPLTPDHPGTMTSTATPTASSAIPSQTGATSNTTSSSSDNTRTTAIAAGVAVPVGTIALAIAAYFFYRTRRIKQRSGLPDGGDDANMHKETAEAAVAGHTAQGARAGLYHEASSDQVPRQEMAGPIHQVLPHEMAVDPTHGSEVLEKDGRPIVEMDASGIASNR